MALKDKVALVLGSIKGLGKEIALDLAESGVKTALTYFDWQENIVSLKQDFDSISETPLIIKINLLDTENISGLISEIIKHYGRLDILINNIERGGMPVVHGAYTKDQWDLELATTLRAKQWVFNEALPHLKKSSDGVVINISSIAGIVGRLGPASYLFNEGYSAANRGISLLTETWARLGAPNVRVNEIMLGIFETRHAEKTRGWKLLNKEQQQAIKDHILLNRTGKSTDIVKAVRFIIKDAPYMTGSVLRLDGGYILGGEKIAPLPKGVI